MKILFLNPHIDAQHKITQALKARGIALIMPSNPEEGWQVLKLHGTSIDLAIIHREGIHGGDPGIELLYKIKKDPSQADLPILFTSEDWSADQCASHQQTPMGANAYLRWPFDETELLSTIDAIFNEESPQAEEPPQARAEESGAELAPPPSVVLETPLENPTTGEVILEAPVAPVSGEISSISLEAPDASAEFEVESSGGAPVISSSIDISLPIAAAGASDALIESSMAIEVVGDLSVAGSLETQDAELSSEMPYLFSKGDSSKSLALDPAAFSRAYSQPVGDAVVPGGAAQSPDAETFKKYLLLREQDVAALSAQLRAAQDELATVKTQLTAERSHAEGLQFTVSDQVRKIEDFEREKALALEGLQAELSELSFQNKAKTDKAKLLESQVREASSEIERLKERVRSDIRKIRVRERELENKLEISKKDSEAILTSRENKIIELKRKLDLLEFNMDLLQDRYSREKENSSKLREKLLKAAQVVRVAEGLLEDPGNVPGSTSGVPEDTKAS